MTRPQRATQANTGGYIGEGLAAAADAAALKRRIAGARARASGGSFEDGLADKHESFAAQGRAFLEPCPIPTRRVGRNRLIPIGPAPIDFFGTMKDGHSLYVEAKSSATRKPSLPVGDMLRPEQLTAMHRRMEFRATCCIVWKNGDQIGVLGPHELLNFIFVYQGGKGRKSIESSRFTWLKAGDWDYLAVIEKELAGQGRDAAC